jgi:hypothetical protein
LLIDTGRQAHIGDKTRFSFELSWLEQEGFYDLIAVEWAAAPIGKTPIQTWQNRIRHLRRFLRGWAKNLSGKYTKEKKKDFLSSLLLWILKQRLSHYQRMSERI